MLGASGNLTAVTTPMARGASLRRDLVTSARFAAPAPKPSAPQPAWP